MNSAVIATTLAAAIAAASPRLDDRLGVAPAPELLPTSGPAVSVPLVFTPAGGGSLHFDVDASIALIGAAGGDAPEPDDLASGDLTHLENVADIIVTTWTEELASQFDATVTRAPATVGELPKQDAAAHLAILIDGDVVGSVWCFVDSAAEVVFAQSAGTGSQLRALPGTGAKALGPLAGIELSAVVELGRAELPVKSLLAMDQGSVIRLTRTVGEPVDLIVNGTVAARGDIVLVDGKLGLRVSEVVAAV